MLANGKLYLDFNKRESGETYISKQFYQLPLQVLPANYVEEDGSAFVYLLNPSSGMLEGDLFDYRFHLRDGAETLLTTPSSNKIYKSRKDMTYQQMEADIGGGCVLEYLPEHNVPYGESRFTQQSIFRVKRGGTLFTWDTVVPGRLARGECFDFHTYRSDIRIYYDGKLKVREMTEIDADTINPLQIGILNKYRIFSSCYVVSSRADSHLQEELRTFLTEKSGHILGGASMPEEDIMVIKILASHVPEFQKTLWDIWNIVRRHILSKDAIRMRKY